MSLKDIKKYCLWKNRDIWETFKDKPWDWHILSENPNITWEIVRDNPDMDWNWTTLSLNILLYEPISNKRARGRDIKKRSRDFKNIFEILSPFSRNIDRIISKRVNYR